jgi:Ca2+/Na+ antiporter
MELAVAINARRGDARDAVVAGLAIVIVVSASVAMEGAATDLGTQAGVPPIVIGGLVLAAVTSLPNAVTAVYLARRGRGVATLSAAFNSNALNVMVGLLIPAAILGLGASSDDTTFVAASYVILTSVTVALTLQGSIDRRRGSIIIVGYLIFALGLITR